MTKLENEVLSALLDLEKAVKSMTGGNSRPDFQSLFARIEELTSQLPAESNPNLLHYLHKKSYEKARLFLQGLDAENAKGSCRHEHA